MRLQLQLAVEADTPKYLAAAANDAIAMVLSGKTQGEVMRPDRRAWFRVERAGATPAAEVAAEVMTEVLAEAAPPEPELEVPSPAEVHIQLTVEPSVAEEPPVIADGPADDAEDLPDEPEDLGVPEEG